MLLDEYLSRSTRVRKLTPHQHRGGPIFPRPEVRRAYMQVPALSRGLHASPNERIMGPVVGKVLGPPRSALQYQYRQSQAVFIESSIVYIS